MSPVDGAAPARKSAQKKALHRTSRNHEPSQDRKARCKRTKSAEKRQASVAQGRKNKFVRRGLSIEVLKREYPWAGDKVISTTDDLRQVSKDIARLRNAKRNLKKSGDSQFANHLYASMKAKTNKYRIRAKSAPTINTTKVAAEGDVVNEEQSHEERQASGAPGRKNKFKRRSLSYERLVQEFPWAGDRQPQSMEESRQISIDMAKLRNIKKKLKKSGDPLIKLADTLYAAMKQKNIKLRRGINYTEGERLAENAYGEIENKSQKYPAAKEDMDERQARANDMSREIVNIVNELDENHSTLVAQSLSMAVAMLRGRESEDIFPKSSRENGSYLKRCKKWNLMVPEPWCK